MQELPLCFRSPMSDVETGLVRRWWDRLTESERQTLVAAYDDRWEECFFGPTPVGDAVPTVSGGRFLADDDAWGFGDWETDWREYLVEHPDVPLMWRFRSSSWLLGGSIGVLNIVIDWTRTRFTNDELPPSERRA